MREITITITLRQDYNRSTTVSHFLLSFFPFFFFFLTVSHFQRYWKVLEGQPAVPEVGALHFRHGEVDCPSPWASLALPGI